jgi:hypothetical protein
MQTTMWIVIGIVSNLVIMKRKSNRKKNLKTCTIILFMFSLCFVPNAKGKDSKQCIYWSISAAQLERDVYVDFKVKHRNIL